MSKDQATKDKIKMKIIATHKRRSKLSCRVFQTKVDLSSLSKTEIDHLNRIFIEAKWLYNDLLSTNNIHDYNTKARKVTVKVGELFEPREMTAISSQMKQSVKTRLFNNLQSLKALKEKGFKTGALKFKCRVNSIPLKQPGKTFSILKGQGKIKIQGMEKAIKVSGLKQLPKDCEIACATLKRSGKDFFINITVYTEKEIREVPEKAIGIDFGCDNQISLSNGTKIRWNFPPSERISKLDQAISRSRNMNPDTKGRNRERLYLLRESAYARNDNRKKDVKNKIVHALTSRYRYIAFQDDSFRGWQAGGHGRKMNGTALGMFRTVLKHKTAVPLTVGQWYPSSQLCSGCGARQKIPRGEKVYTCPSCGMVLDRDVNAARNILAEGMKEKKIPVDCGEFKPMETCASAVAGISEMIPHVMVSTADEVGSPMTLVVG